MLKQARQIETITARFSGGPLHGSRINVNIDKHVYTDRSSGTEYRLITYPVGSVLIRVYIARGQTPAEQQINLNRVLALV